jgi:hypothetical protein
MAGDEVACRNDLLRRVEICSVWNQQLPEDRQATAMHENRVVPDQPFPFALERVHP